MTNKYTVNTPDGAVTVDAVSSQVDDSGTLGFHDADGHMSHSFVKGQWTPAADGAAPEPDKEAAPWEAPAKAAAEPAATETVDRTVTLSKTGTVQSAAFAGEPHEAAPAAVDHAAEDPK